MSKKQLTVAAAGMLVLSIQVGCQGAGRFSREQYAQLEVDPFLVAESSQAEADDVSFPIMAADAKDGLADRSDLVNGRNSKRGEDSISRDTKGSRPQISSRSGVVPSAGPDFGNSLAQSRIGQTATDSDAGFDEFLRQNVAQVAQVSAVAQAGSSARQRVMQADHTVFPAAHQKVEIQDPVNASSAAEINPFAVSDQSSSDESGSSVHDASWRPGNFKDVILAD
jgi:hypothetical protein